MEQDSQTSTSASLAWVVPGYLLLSLLYTYPLIFHLFDGTLFLGMNYSLIANARLVLEELAALRSPFEIARIFFPVGYTIHEGLLPSFLVACLGLGRNMLLGLNLSLLASFFLGGLGAYLLCLRLTGDRLSSFVAGCYFTFSAQHYGNLGTYPMVHLQWLPWFTYALVQFGSGGGKGPLLLALACFIAATLSSWYYAVFIGLITGVYLLISALQAPEQWRRWTVLAGSLSGCGLLLLPLSPGLLLGDYGLATGGFRFFVEGSADALSFFLPPFFHWKLAGWVQSIQADWLGNPSLRANYLGTLSLAVALFGIFRGSIRPGRNRAFLIAIALLGIVLALGPYLVVDGVGGSGSPTPEDSTEAMRLPYFWLSHLFPFSITRAVSRYSLLTLLALSVFLAAGLATLTRQLTGARARSLVLAGALAVLGLELWPVWPHEIKHPVPVSQFHRDLQQRSEDFSVIELPFDIGAYRTLYYATAHSRKVLGGSIDKPFTRFMREIAPYPFLRELVSLDLRDPLTVQDIYGSDYPRYVSSVLDSLKVRYAVLHKWDEGILSYGDYYQPEPDYEKVRKLISGHFKSSFEDRLVAVYERELSQEWLYPLLGEGWGRVENHGTYADRPLLGTRAVLEIVSSRNGNASVDIEIAVILVAERTVEFHLNGEMIHSERVARRSKAGSWHSIRLDPVELLEGKNHLVISTPEPARSISEVYGGEDARRISLLLHRISLSPEGRAP